MATRSVLIADSNTRLSQLVGQLLADESSFRVLGVLCSTEAALQAAEEQRPDIILLSERLEGRPTDELCERLRRVAPEAALVVWSHDPTSRDKGQAVADAVIERGTTFRQFVRDLRQIADRGSDPADHPTVIWADEHLPPLPPPSVSGSSGLLDDPDRTGGLLLNCDSCAVQVRLTTDDIAPAVDEARAFFVEHARCQTAIELTERSALRVTG